MDFDGPYVFRHGDLWFEDSARTREDRPSNLFMSGRRVCGPSDMLAVCFDSVDGVIHKHGMEADVSKWAEGTRAKLRSFGCPEAADALVVASFIPVPEAVAELNACIACSGRISGFPEFLARLAPTVEVPDYLPYVGR